MKYILILVLFTSFQQQKPMIGTFDGRTPCDKLEKYLTEKARPECIKIKWRLILYKDNTYELTGLTYKKVNPRIGKWHISKGTPSNPDAIVYELVYPDDKTILLQKMDDNIFFFLDTNRNILVGNSDFSYTLNRKKGVGF
jgi:hypothetical protein